ncbi:MAG TPA: YciI family protein [Rickettsiales bacterium]|nr:YciI family protein [Rickettsiales bacterium]
MIKYLVMTTRKPTFQQSAIEPHYAFLDELRKQGKLEYAGPFTDKTGGAYLLKVKDMEEAKSIAFRDPVYTTNSSDIKIYEWDAKA